MKYDEFLQKTTFSQAELLANAWGTLVTDPPWEGIPTLPAPPLLMFDRITHVSHQQNQGKIIAEQDIHLDSWFFQCHFRSDPVQPGCLGVDAIWQLIGFYASLRGAKGAGRALGSQEIEFSGQIRPHNKIVRYEVEIRRHAELPRSGTTLTIGSGKIFVDDELIYTIKDAKVGVFVGISYSDYPHRSRHSTGGSMEKERQKEKKRETSQDV